MFFLYRRHRRYYSDDSDSDSDGYRRRKKRKTYHKQSNMDEMMDMMKMKIMMSMVGADKVKAEPEPSQVKPETVKADPAVKDEPKYVPKYESISLPVIASMPSQIAPDPKTVKARTKPGSLTITMNGNI